MILCSIRENEIITRKTIALNMYMLIIATKKKNNWIKCVQAIGAQRHKLPIEVKDLNYVYCSSAKMKTHICQFKLTYMCLSVYTQTNVRNIKSRQTNLDFRPMGSVLIEKHHFFCKLIEFFMYSYE